MNTLSWTRSAALVLSLLIASACSDTPTAPRASTPDASLEDASNHELLVQILGKLNALEARVDREALALRARMDSAVSLGMVTVGGQAPVLGASGEVGIEATICTATEGELEVKVKSKVEVKAGGDGKVGADVYGNGVMGRLHAMASQIAGFAPGAKSNLKLELCGKLGGSGSLGTALMGSPRLAVKAGTSPLQPILEGVLQSGNINKMVSAASTLGMDGSKLGAALDVINNFGSGDLVFGQNPGASLVNAFPLPLAVRNLIANPMSLLQKGPEALQFAIDRLCSQTFFTGELAQLGAQACSLRGNWPAPGTLINILQGLNGLPQTIGTIQSDLSGACSTITAILPASVTIPSKTVTFPLGIGDVQVFPGYHKALFAGINSPC